MLKTKAVSYCKLCNNIIFGTESYKILSGRAYHKTCLTNAYFKENDIRKTLKHGKEKTKCIA